MAASVILLALLALHVAASLCQGHPAFECPSEEFIHPCKCRSFPARPTHVLCSGISNLTALKTPFLYLNSYQLGTLALQYIEVPVTVDMFSGLSVANIKILDSVYKIDDGGRTAKAPCTFSNLEGSLRMVYVSNTTLDLGDSCLGQVKALTQVFIQSSRIDVLRKGWFEGLTRLESFSLSDSTVRRLDDEVLSGLEHVDKIVLRSNGLRVMQRNYFPPIASYLTTLDIR